MLRSLGFASRRDAQGGGNKGRKERKPASKRDKMVELNRNMARAGAQGRSPASSLGHVFALRPVEPVNPSELSTCAKFVVDDPPTRPPSHWSRWSVGSHG